MELIEAFTGKVKERNFRVALPEGADERIIRAARRLKDEAIAEPVILGKPEQMQAAIEKAGVTLDDIETINPKQSDKLDAYTKKYIEGRDDITAAVAKRMVAKPLFYAGMMVACGDANAAVAGAVSATATVIQAGTLTIGLMPGIKTVSSYFLMVIPDFLGEKNKPFIYADCAVNIAALRAGQMSLFFQTLMRAISPTSLHSIWPVPGRLGRFFRDSQNP